MIQWQLGKNMKKKLDAKASILNKEQFVKLHYTAPGTDLTLGMPKTMFGKVLEA